MLSKQDYPACARGDGNVPGGSGVHATNEMVVDLTEGNGSEDTRKRTEKKSAVQIILVVQPRTKTSKVSKIRVLRVRH